MEIYSVILFFIYTYCLGFTATYFIKNSDNFLERNIMRTGIGLAILSFLAVFINFFGLPVDWKIMLLLSISFPSYILFKKMSKKELKMPELGKFELTKSNIYSLLAIIIFSFALFMYSSGAFKYPYLEDDDPWSYALATKYVAVEKNLNDPGNLFKFMDPYPPGYVSTMGILHQTSSSLSWTLKFFNALIISLGILFFYFFSSRFTKDRSIALFSTFALAMIPSFFTHFIWAITLSVVLFFVLMYCLERMDDDKTWAYPSAIVFSGFMMTQPSMMLKIAILLSVYFIIKSVLYKKFQKHTFYAIFSGSLLSLLWWATRWQTLLASRIKSETLNISGVSIAQTSTFTKFWTYLSGSFSPTSGTATRPYTFNDFFMAKTQGLINAPVGLGILITLLAFLGIIYIIANCKSSFKKESYWIPITLLWLVLLFLNVNSATFNIPGFFSFRSWILLAIPVSLLCSLGVKTFLRFGKKIDIPSAVIIIVLIGGIFLTSGYQKYALNTSAWPPGQGWTSVEEVNGYSWLKNLPENTKVFAYSTEDSIIIGFDKYSCSWCSDVIYFREHILEKDAEQLHSWLKNTGYDYLIISGMSYTYLGNKFGENKTKEAIDSLLEDLSKSGKFQAAYQTQGAIILKVL